MRKATTHSRLRAISSVLTDTGSARTATVTSVRICLDDDEIKSAVDFDEAISINRDDDFDHGVRP